MNVKYEIEEITLLSIEEYEQYRSVIPSIDEYWWLRSPGEDSDNAAYIHYYDVVNKYGAAVDTTGIGVRPALRINVSDTSSLQPGNKVQLLFQVWTVLDVKENQIYVLADDIVGRRRFDSKSNSWESSELKKWINSQH